MNRYLVYFIGQLVLLIIALVVFKFLCSKAYYKLHTKISEIYGEQNNYLHNIRKINASELEAYKKNIADIKDDSLSDVKPEINNLDNKISDMSNIIKSLSAKINEEFSEDNIQKVKDAYTEELSKITDSIINDILNDKYAESYKENVLSLIDDSAKEINNKAKIENKIIVRMSHELVIQIMMELENKSMNNTELDKDEFKKLVSFLNHSIIIPCRLYKSCNSCNGAYVPYTLIHQKDRPNSDSIDSQTFTVMVYDNTTKNLSSLLYTLRFDTVVTSDWNAIAEFYRGRFPSYEKLEEIVD